LVTILPILKVQHTLAMKLLRLGTDLYIDPTLSVGVSFMDTTFDDFDTVWAVRAQKFFTPAIMLA
jgi:hypothetical protein